jgi:hypothetical protein
VTRAQAEPPPGVLRRRDRQDGDCPGGGPPAGRPRPR